MIASHTGHVQVVAELLQYGASVDKLSEVQSFRFSCFVFVLEWDFDAFNI